MGVYKFDNGKVEPLKKMTGAEIIEEESADAADTLERLKNNPHEDPFAATDAAETALAAAIDRATGFADAGKDGRSPRLAAPAGLLTQGGYGAPEPQPEEAGAEARQPKTDWVEEAYRCFIKDAGDIDPTDPVKAVEAYFQKNATDELKARCKAEGKDAKGCWTFIEAVARKALHGSSGHIDPAVVYAIAMHWFEDVPKDWDKAAKAEEPKKESKVEKLERKVAQSHVSHARKAELRKELAEAKRKERAKAKKPAETPSEIRKEKERMAKAKAKAKAKVKAKKPKQQQGFFFEMLEMPVEGGTEK